MTANQRETQWHRVIDPDSLDEGEVINSYQAMLTPMSFPPAMGFPGHSEFLSVLDGIPDVSVDWAMRVRRRDRESAMQLNEKVLGKLGVQLGEHLWELGPERRSHRIALARADQRDLCDVVGDLHCH